MSWDDDEMWWSSDVSQAAPVDHLAAGQCGDGGR